MLCKPVRALFSLLFFFFYTQNLRFFTTVFSIHFENLSIPIRFPSRNRFFDDRLYTLSLFEHSPNDKPIIWRTFPIVVTREDGASCDEIKLGGSFEQGVKPRTVFRRGYIDRYFSVACEKEVDQLRTKPIPLLATRSGYRGQPRVVLATRISACLSLSLSRSRRIFRSWSATSISSEAREYYVWATSMDTCNSLLYRPRPLKLLCAPWFNTRRHCLRLARLFILSERGPKWIFLLDFVSSRREDECCAISFFFLHFLCSIVIFFVTRYSIKDTRLISFVSRRYSMFLFNRTNPVGGRKSPECGVLYRFVNGFEARGADPNPDTFAWLSCITLLHRFRLSNRTLYTCISVPVNRST